MTYRWERDASVHESWSWTNGRYVQGAVVRSQTGDEWCAVTAFGMPAFAGADAKSKAMAHVERLTASVSK